LKQLPVVSGQWSGKKVGLPTSLIIPVPEKFFKSVAQAFQPVPTACQSCTAWKGCATSYTTLSKFTGWAKYPCLT
jgi:hypothetical protein